jgi:hypothetical protein
VLGLAGTGGAAADEGDAAAPPPEGSLQPALLRQRCVHVLETLGEALKSAPRLEAGAPELREPVQSVAFAAGWMAGVGASIGDVVALVHGLQEVMDPELRGLGEALMVVATEAFVAARRQRAAGQYRDAMEKCQVVCPLHSRLPCLWLVGDPDRQAVDRAAGRLMMLAAMRQAPAVLVDCAGLLAAQRTLEESGALLREHVRESACHVVLSGLPRDLWPRLAPGGTEGAEGAAAQGLSLHDDFPAALAEAAARCGLSGPGD